MTRSPEITDVMVEKAARALFEAGDWDLFPEGTRREWRKSSRAALEAVVALLSSRATAMPVRALENDVEALIEWLTGLSDRGVIAGSNYADAVRVIRSLTAPTHRDEIIEECAKVADAKVSQYWGRGEPMNFAAVQIATAIRALKDSPHD